MANSLNREIEPGEVVMISYTSTDYSHEGRSNTIRSRRMAMPNEPAHYDIHIVMQSSDAAVLIADAIREQRQKTEKLLFDLKLVESAFLRVGANMKEQEDQADA